MLPKNPTYEKNRLLRYINKNKIDVVCITFFICLSFYYATYLRLMQAPMWDGTAYLLNAKSWLTNTPLFEIYRPPLISLLIAGTWLFTGENWVIVKALQASFTIGAGILLYMTIRKHKGGLFALGVTALTMLNSYVFFFSTQILTEGISLFFLVATLYFLKSEKERDWYLAGIALGLTFAARYPIIIQAVTLFIIEAIIRKNWKLFTKTIIGASSVIFLTISSIFLKTGTFQTALPKDSQLSIFLSPFYLSNSLTIWGVAFILVPIALLSRKTYEDKYNYSFIAWFLFALMFWSANVSKYDFRFTIQFTPAVYYLTMLAIENTSKSRVTINNIALELYSWGIYLQKNLSSLKKDVSTFMKDRTKFHFTISIIFWSALVAGTPLYIPTFIESFSFSNVNSYAKVAPITGYVTYPNYALTENFTCQFIAPIQKTIILRLDDIQNFAWREIGPKLTDNILGRNMSVTLGVIPRTFGNTNKKSETLSYLISKVNNPKVELAQHGTNHKDMEYLNLSEDETHDLAKTGYETIVKTFGVYPVTFIPPNNAYNENTTKTLSKLGFAILSAKQDEYKFDGYAMHTGFTAQTKYSDKTELEPVHEVINSCKTSLESKNICVIVIHPQDYVNDDKKTLNETRYAEFVKFLDELQKLDAKSATFRDLIRCAAS